MKLGWDSLKYFRPREFSHPELVDPKLVDMLDEMRNRCGFRMDITSSYRSGPHMGKRKSSHQVGSDGFYHGVDIAAATGRKRYYLVQYAISVGFRRIGVYDRHIHLDVATDRMFIQEVLWPGKSK